MINKSVLKEIILSNEEYILNQVGDIVDRPHAPPPDRLKKVIIFYGVRRSGKTFILFDLFRKNADCSLYLDFEDERLVEFQLEDFDRLKEAFLELKPHLYGKRLVFLLDEVQNIPGWEKYCRRAVERENIKVYISGSSSRIVPDKIHTGLRGRSWSMEVLPFSFREYLQCKGLDEDDKSTVYGPRKVLVKKHFADYLKWGGSRKSRCLRPSLKRTSSSKSISGPCSSETWWRNIG